MSLHHDECKRIRGHQTSTFMWRTSNIRGRYYVDLLPPLHRRRVPRKHSAVVADISIPSHRFLFLLRLLPHRPQCFLVVAGHTLQLVTQTRPQELWNPLGAAPRGGRAPLHGDNQLLINVPKSNPFQGLQDKLRVGLRRVVRNAVKY